MVGQRLDQLDADDRAPPLARTCARSRCKTADRARAILTPSSAITETPPRKKASQRAQSPSIVK
jgi:hypothetical protein